MRLIGENKVTSSLVVTTRFVYFQLPFVLCQIPKLCCFKYAFTLAYFAPNFGIEKKLIKGGVII